jgi:membrane-bound lytic murein transglycosylase B
MMTMRLRALLGLFILAALPLFISISLEAETRLGRGMTPEECSALAMRIPAEWGQGAFVDSLKAGAFLLYEDALTVNLHGRDGSHYYETFKSPETHAALRSFLQEKKDLLARVHQKTGVPPEIVAAILMIETRLGTITGDYPCADLFLSLQFLEDRAGGANLDSAVVREQREGGDRDRSELAKTLKKRATSRSKWALKELKSLLTQFSSGEWMGQKGSWAGAMGYCQFLPSSRAAYAVDGDGDGQIDLHSFDDAAFSVGNYLKNNGWKPNQSDEGRRKVIRRYNHSDHYVDAVCELAEVGK